MRDRARSLTTITGDIGPAQSQDTEQKLSTTIHHITPTHYGGRKRPGGRAIEEDVRDRRHDTRYAHLTLIGGVRLVGFEPTTCGLRVRCSAVELEARRGV